MKTVVVACGYWLQAAANEARPPLTTKWAAVALAIDVASLAGAEQFYNCSHQVSCTMQLVHSHKTNVVIVTLLSFVMIYNTVRPYIG